MTVRSKVCGLLLFAALFAVARAADLNAGPAANGTAPANTTSLVATNGTAGNTTAPAAGAEDRKKQGGGWWRGKGPGSWGDWSDQGGDSAPDGTDSGGDNGDSAVDGTDGSDGSEPCARHKPDGSWDYSNCGSGGSGGAGDGSGDDSTDSSDGTDCTYKGDGSWGSGCGGDNDGWSGGDDGSDGSGGGDWNNGDDESDGSGGGDWSNGDDESDGSGGGDWSNGDDESDGSGGGDWSNGDDESDGGDSSGDDTTPPSDPAVPSPPSDPAVPSPPSDPAVPSPPNDPTAPPAPGTAGGCPDIQATLDAHNAARTARGAAALVWNDTLATFAQGVSQTCKFEHSNGPYGENLAMGVATCKEAVDLWMGEASQYDASKGFDANTGHFTQLVWKATTQVGCGLACNIVTCNYDPAGNVEGQYADNV